MEVPAPEVTVLAGRDDTLSLDAHTTRPPRQLTVHVLGIHAFACVCLQADLTPNTQDTEQ
jgi:hypothetical protein